MDASPNLSELEAAVGDGSVSTDPAVRRGRARDRWALAMLREVRGDPPSLPLAVVFPPSTDGVAAVLSWAVRTGTQVVPRGGGSGVCGGAQAGDGWLVLDLSRMDGILGLDVESRVVHAQAGVRGDLLEDALEPHGLTVGHYPQSIAISTVGGWIGASSAGQASAGFGAIEDLVVGMTAVLSGGEVLRLRPVPRSAAGPDLRRLMVGSEGTLAVVTEAHLACSRRPAGWTWDAYRFDSFVACMAGLRDVLRAETGCAVVRGYDDVDSTLNFGRIGHQLGCVAIVGFDAGLAGLDERRAAARTAAAASGAEDAGAAYGEHWWEHRNDAVATYERIMGPERWFGPGVVVDTMEVAGLWSSLPRLYEAVRAALSGHAEAVGCHLSHLYPSGSSLYFTFMVRGSDDLDAERRYMEAWADGAQACLGAGGTVTHHHGVGRLKAPFLERELGAAGVEVLRRIKSALDPAGLLNPASLLP